ncbi:MAG: helix-turn-helix domain-containing protein [Pseudomonadota bacterium]
MTVAAQAIAPSDGQQDAVAARAAWITAARQALLSHGPDGVTISSLARGLKLTRGAFYWHFKNREDLLGDLLEECRAGARLTVFDRLPKLGFGKGVLRLLDTLHQPTTTELEALAFDRALRRWGREDAMARTAVDVLDSERSNIIEHLFRDAGFSLDEAKLRAMSLCDQIVSSSITGPRYTRAEYATHLFGLYLMATGCVLAEAEQSHHINYDLPHRLSADLAV